VSRAVFKGASPAALLNAEFGLRAMKAADVF